MSVEDNKTLVRAAYDSISAGELDGFMDRLADDVKWTFFGKHRFAGTLVGKEDILNNLLTPLADKLVNGLKINYQYRHRRGRQSCHRSYWRIESSRRRDIQ
jgi:ketosteroid isomerase-like protein